MTKSITAEEFDKKFDNGEDVSEYVDWSSAKRVNKEAKRVNVDFPVWMVEAMDREADRIGISRQAFIKVIVAERLGDPGRP
jgi:predicted DNA binding CopG/RHH family protein